MNVARRTISTRSFYRNPQRALIGSRAVKKQLRRLNRVYAIRRVQPPTCLTVPEFFWNYSCFYNYDDYLHLTMHSGLPNHMTMHAALPIKLINFAFIIYRRSQKYRERSRRLHIISLSCWQQTKCELIGPSSHKLPKGLLTLSS